MQVAIYDNLLLLDRVEIDDKNNISGFVINGAWFYKEQNGLGYAFDFNTNSDNYSCAVNSWKLSEDSKVVVVPEKLIGKDYNEILHHCKNYKDQRKYLSSLIEGRNKNKDYKCNNFDDDDLITF